MRNQPSQQRSRLTVRALLRAANDEFAEHGFHGAQMTRIASRADVSVGSMYRFFPDKETFVEALVEGYGDAMAQTYREVLSGFTGRTSALEVTRALVRAAADLQLEHAGYYSLTSAMPPNHQDSPGHSVRTTLIGILFENVEISEVETLELEGLQLVLEFALEATRARLANMPASGPVRDKLVDELEAMIVAYVGSRLYAMTRQELHAG